MNKWISRKWINSLSEYGGIGDENDDRSDDNKF